jgi:hypothetical protein
VGVLLCFTSVESASPEVEAAIRAEPRERGGGRSWVLCEPPHFYPTEEDGLLRGGSKLNLHPWADELAEVSKAPGERNDLQELLRLLCAWSGRHGLTWELEVDGMPLGRIEGGACQGDVEGALEAFADLAEYLGEEFPREWPDYDGGEPPGGRGLRIWEEPE